MVVFHGVFICVVYISFCGLEVVVGELSQLLDSILLFNKLLILYIGIVSMEVYICIDIIIISPRQG